MLFAIRRMEPVNIDSQIEQEITRSLDTLFRDMPARTLSRTAMETVLRQTATRSAQWAQSGVLLSLLTAENVAEQLHVTSRRVRALARRRQIGWQVPGTHQWLFTPDEIESLRPGLPGRPSRRSTP